MNATSVALATAQLISGLFLTMQAYGRVEVVEESTFHATAIAMYIVCMLSLIFHTQNGTKSRTRRMHTYNALIVHLWFIFVLMAVEDGFVYTWRNIIGNIALVDIVLGVGYLCLG
jgi:hypothetical protein